MQKKGQPLLGDYRHRNKPGRKKQSASQKNIELLSTCRNPRANTIRTWCAWDVSDPVTEGARICTAPMRLLLRNQQRSAYASRINLQ
jgi:hypothetical protein